MSVLFDPKQKTISHPHQSKADPKTGLCERLADAIYEGEIAFAQQRCVRIWTQQTGLSADQAPNEFMEPCRASQIVLMRFFRELRRNTIAF